MGTVRPFPTLDDLILEVPQDPAVAAAKTSATTVTLLSCVGPGNALTAMTPSEMKHVL